MAGCLCLHETARFMTFKFLLPIPVQLKEEGETYFKAVITRTSLQQKPFVKKISEYKMSQYYYDHRLRKLRTEGTVNSTRNLANSCLLPLNVI